MMSTQLGSGMHASSFRSPRSDLPIRTAASSFQDLPSSHESISRSDLVRLLVVDDDLSTIECLSWMLKDFAQVSFATSGEEALHMAHLHQPDLVLLDLEMAGMGGPELCRQLRAEPGLQSLPVLGLAGQDTPDIEASALRRGVDDFVRKPFRAQVLCERMRSLINIRKAAPRGHAAPTRGPLGSDRIAALVNACDDAMLVTDAEGRILLANTAACTLFKCNDGALHQLPLASLLVVDAEGTCSVCRPGGQRIAVEARSTTEGSGTEALTLHVLRDTRERDRAQALLRQQNETAAARHATSAMLSYIAHEIGNPVNIIKGFAQLMQVDAGAPLAPSQAGKLAHILDAVSRLSDLLADVGNVARMESGKFHVELVPVDLCTLARQACEQTQAQAAAAGLQLFAPQQSQISSESVHVRADARRLRQCLDNLLSNAIKYGNAGGSVEVEIQARDSHMVLAVQDHGCGFSEEQLAHLFEPYNRLGRDGGTIPGTGLGLMLTRDLVRAMDGQLLVRSRPGKGARFEILLQHIPNGGQQD